ncbi:hypothetical protein SAMN04487850_0005 [Prevotella aff. ruminicola Tc2-24]|jgi:hypothetical protein|uniref:Uncharacterized protein n=1 Tax=Prevotella aff. ruminicola Tc2-24 TaxID=81582 RepID=A0A1I0LYD0_9BACT|nr:MULTISPECIES: hypothetical protein [Prevotella]SED97430.1 hypothetical protein SAMN04487828_0007 [Prevotella sp. lc2012]SEV79788.1 hypothetical protein SAMN04487850_0005 [Prevotella aff. ruminicola Tc2-24]
MKKLILATLLVMTAISVSAQQENRPFRAHLYNSEYDVFLRIDFYDESITVPGQDLYGSLPGYLGKTHNSFCWLITTAKVKGHTAHIALINDYGSEDLTATLTVKNDSIYELKQVEGSALKVPKDGKWQKLPKVLTLKRR